MGKKNPETASQMLESLNDFLLEPESDFRPMPSEKVTAYLKKNKLDAARVTSAVQAKLDELCGQMALARAREKRLSIERKIPAGRSLGARATLLEKIRALAGSQAAAVYARKFEDAADADLGSLLEDFEFLDQLEFDDDE